MTTGPFGPFLNSSPARVPAEPGAPEGRSPEEGWIDQARLRRSSVLKNAWDHRATPPSRSLRIPPEYIDHDADHSVGVED